jgi:hypothetical protein
MSTVLVTLDDDSVRLTKHGDALTIEAHDLTLTIGAEAGGVRPAELERGEGWLPDVPAGAMTPAHLDNRHWITRARTCGGGEQG